MVFTFVLYALITVNDLVFHEFFIDVPLVKTDRKVGFFFVRKRKLCIIIL